jgi:prefoldin subunit 1
MVEFTRISFLQEKIKALENSKEYLEKSVKESENNLRELISHKKSAS